MWYAAREPGSGRRIPRNVQPPIRYSSKETGSTLSQETLNGIPLHPVCPGGGEDTRSHFASKRSLAQPSRVAQRPHRPKGQEVRKITR